MVVIEALKHRFNRGKKSKLYFYRDSKGNEVDLLFATGPDLFPIEIKAGMTINKDYFKGLNQFTKLFPDNIPNGSGIVYTGATEQKRTSVHIAPFEQLTRLFKSAASI